jgi:hypothetical protein
MKNTNIKKAVRLAFCSLLIVAFTLFTACPTPLTKGENSTVSITIGSSSNVSRAAVPWDDSIDREDLIYTVIMSGGPGAVQQQGGIKYGDTVRFSVYPGTWTVTVQGYEGTLLVTEGVSSVTVKSGGNNSVPVTMKEKPPVFDSIPAFASWLNGKPPNNDNPEKPYNVKLNISSFDGGVSTPTSLGYMLVVTNPNKYVNLDLSGSNITSIPYIAFGYGNGGCDNLVGITLPNGVITIGESAFCGCGLFSVIIPNSVTSVEAEAFIACTSLTSVKFEGTILSSAFDVGAFGIAGNSGYIGDLRAKFYATDPNNGTPGTYTRSPNGATWTKTN